MEIETVAVIQKDAVSREEVIRHECHRAICDGVHRRSLLRSIVRSAVRAAWLSVDDAPRPETASRRQRVEGLAEGQGETAGAAA